MNRIFSELILYFIIYSIIGWLWETIYCSIKAKKFLYRGFLIGPYCPIYGFGILMVLYFIEPFHKNLILLYIFSTIIVTLLEFLTSYFLEKIFHTTWWDYHNVPFNIQGRIALPISAFWGVACVIVVRCIHPFVEKLVNFLYESYNSIIPIAVLLILTIDTVLSILNMLSLQNTLKKFNQKLEDQAKKLELSFETRAQHFNTFLETKNMKNTAKLNELKEKIRYKKENLELVKHIRKLKFNEKRLLEAFPDMKVKKIKNFKNSKELLLKFSQKKSIKKDD